MRLKDFMSTQVETITAKETVSDAEAKMRLNRIRHLVVMSGKTIVGVISERNLSGMSEYEKQGYLVEDVMEDQVVTASPDSTVRDAANLMRGRTIGSLPIVDDKGKLVGIITTTDLLTLLGQGVERVTPDTKKRIVMREPGRRPPGMRRV